MTTSPRIQSDPPPGASVSGAAAADPSSTMPTSSSLTSRRRGHNVHHNMNYNNPNNNYNNAYMHGSPGYGYANPGYGNNNMHGYGYGNDIVIINDDKKYNNPRRKGGVSSCCGCGGGAISVLLGMVMGVIMCLSVLLFHGSNNELNASMTKLIGTDPSNYFSNLSFATGNSSPPSSSAQVSSSSSSSQQQQQQVPKLQQQQQQPQNKPYRHQSKDNQKVLSSMIHLGNSKESTPLLFPPTHIGTLTNTTTTTQTMTKKKKDDGPNVIVYMSQGPADAYPKLAQRLSAMAGGANGETLTSYRFIYHSYDKDCNGCIYKANTTFASGKNLLVKHLISVSSPDIPLEEQYKYIVLFDDDIQVLESQDLGRYNNAVAAAANETKEEKVYKYPPSQSQATINQIHVKGWKTFHNYLLDPTTIYPLVKPRHHWYDRMDNFIDTYQSCTDECIWAIRPDYLYFFFPYITTKDGSLEVNNWVNALSLWAVMEKCFPAGMKSLKDWQVMNTEHRYDTTSGAYQNHKHKSRLVNALLQHRLPSLAPWPVDAMGHRCNVRGAPSVGIHPECSRVTKHLFDEWTLSELGVQL